MPGNQPTARFQGHLAAVARPADPVPDWLGSAPVPHGIILAPDENIPWMARSVFNPAAIVKDGKVYLLIRAEDATGAGKWFGTSRIGLAESEDGIHFTVHPEPVMGPTEPYEALGGTEDPRIIEITDPALAKSLGGQYAMTYTAFRYEEGKDGMASLALAVSDDLKRWTKKGLMLPDVKTERNPKGWSKSGAVVPQKVNGEHLMYFGDTNIYLARSPDMLKWTVDPEPVLRPRPGYWDGIMVEPGPAPWVDEGGDIHMLYNGDAPPNGYGAGEVVFSGKSPTQVLRRSNTPMVAVSKDIGRDGQVGNVIFLEGLAHHQNKSFFYYGAADDKIAVSVADAPRRGPS